MSYVAHSKDVVCSEGTLIHSALQSLLYLWLLSIISQFSEPLGANFAIFLVKLFSCDQNFFEYNANTTVYSALMFTESKYIASVQSIFRGTAQEVAEFTKLMIKF